MGLGGPENPPKLDGGFTGLGGPLEPPQVGWEHHRDRRHWNPLHSGWGVTGTHQHPLGCVGWGICPSGAVGAMRGPQGASTTSCAPHPLHSPRHHCHFLLPLPAPPWGPTVPLALGGVPTSWGGPQPVGGVLAAPHPAPQPRCGAGGCGRRLGGDLARITEPPDKTLGGGREGINFIFTPVTRWGGLGLVPLPRDTAVGRWGC